MALFSLFRNFYHHKSTYQAPVVEKEVVEVTPPFEASNYSVGTIYFNDSTSGINKYDPSTGETELLVKADRVFFDIATTTDGSLYGIQWSGDVYKIDTDSGESTKIADIGRFTNALVGDSYNNLYAASYTGSLYKMSADGSDVTEIGHIGNSSGDLVIIDDTLYLTTKESNLVAFDLNTNESQVIGKAPADSFGLTKGSDGKLIAFDKDGKVYDVDPSTGTYTYTGNDIDQNGQLYGATNAFPQSFENNDPIAEDDYATAQQDNVLVIAGATLLANDTDPDGDDIFTFTVDSAVNGTVGYNQLTDEVTFTPDAGYAGPASFSYTIVDDKNGSDSATVNLVVEAAVVVNPAPIANDDTIDPTDAAQIIISAADLLANDGEYASAALGTATNGSVFYDNGNVVFTPTAGYNGPASFEYTLFNAEGVGSTATVNLTIEPAVIVNPPSNVLTGTSGDDHIQGTDADETIFSGAGNDLMIGGNGADTFAWDLSDITSGTPASTDTVIADFSDRLDLSDLLIGEQVVDSDESAAEALDDYLDFSVNANGSTVIEVNVFGQNDDNNSTTDHIIEIAGYDATAGNSLSDVQVINNLMNSGHLITDLG
jgi:hypothetical protein